jgi:hypothetical protein
LDELDTRAAGIDHAWDAREANLSVTRFLLQTFCPQERRKETVLDALPGSSNLFAVARLVQLEIRTRKENSHSPTFIFGDADLQQLTSVCVSKLKKAANEGTILESPDSIKLLWLWAALDSQKAVRDWVSSQIRETSKLPFFLSRLITRTTSSGHGEEKVHYYITRKNLESYFNLDAELENRLKGINTADLPRWEKFAVVETLKQIAEKRAGVKEENWPP